MKLPLRAARPATAAMRFAFAADESFFASDEMDACGSCTKDSCDVASLFTAVSNCCDDATVGSGKLKMLIAAIRDPRLCFAASHIFNFFAGAGVNVFGL
jgi:hypothetical protein